MAARSFLEILAQEPVVFDGGMGTMLYGKGVFINRCFEELNVSSPELVGAVHAEYVRAGAEVIESNTFGANAVKLEAHGCRDALAEINRRGVALARSAAGDAVLVAGSMGPLGIKIEPWGPTSVDEARALFREQATALLEGGVDLIVLETFSDINEIQQAIRAVRELEAGIPIVAQMTLGEDGNSLYGTAPEVFAQRLEQWGADVIGVNCSVGPAIMLDALERMARAVRRPLSVQPNAGLPRNVDGRNIYLASPEYMSTYARRFVAAGARAIGGCCGTTPAHVLAIRRAVKAASHEHRPRGSVAVAQGESPVALEPAARPGRSRLATRLAERRFVVVAEIAPPRGPDATAAIEAAQFLLAHRIDLVDVPEAPRASAHMSPESLALLLERETGVETVVHYVCAEQHLLGMQKDLIGAYALGLRNVVCETGDGPQIGEVPGLAGPVDVDSIGLTNVVRRLNQGFDVGGSALGQPTGWYAGVMVNPTAINLEEEVRRFEWKVDAGAEFCITGAVFDLDALTAFLKRIEHCRIPVLLGLHPLASYEEAEYLTNELPGCSVPKAALERMRDASERSLEHARAEGVRLARELLLEARSQVEGVVLATAPGRTRAAVDIASALDAA